MKQRRDLIILLALFLILVVFTVLGPGRSQDDSLSETPTTHSSEAAGAMALLRWTRLLGYDASQLQYTDFAIDEQTDALFILNPSVGINRTEAALVLDWVNQGGTLVLVEDRPFSAPNALLNELQVDIDGYTGETAGGLLDAAIEVAPVLQPVFNTPPLQEVLARTDQIVASPRDDVAYLLGFDADPVLIGIRQGRGYIYLSSALFPFTNAGLRDERNAALMLNLLRRVPQGGRILFDEYHHGFFTPPSLRTALLDSPWGWAAIYALIVLVAYLILTGRRFGRPVPLREEVALRSSAEYVKSMADLFQRGGKRSFILQHYYKMFKRRLARPYGINPNLDDTAFVAELSRYANIPQNDLTTLLQRLRAHQISEADLVRAIADADAVDIGRRA